VKTALEERRNRQTKAAHDIFDALPAGMKSPAAQNVLDGAVRSANAEYAADLSSARQTAGQGLFIHFLVYEIDQVDNLVLGAVNLQPAVVVTSIRNFFITAPAWAFIVHPIFFILFFLWLLLIGSIFGGGITRVAAVQVARDEKISIRQALRFSSGKVLSFIFAPLIPLIIIGVLGLILAAVTCLISLPGIGGIWSVVVGVLFFLAILAGLAVAAQGNRLAPIAPFAALPVCAVCLGLSVRPPSPKFLRPVGWTLIGATALTAVILVVQLG